MGARDDQLAMLTKALRVFSQLINTVQTRSICTRDSYTNMRHHIEDSTPNHSGKSIQQYSSLTMSALDPSLLQQSASIAPRVAYKDLDKILPSKPNLLDSDISNVEDWDDSSEDEGVEEAAEMLDNCANSRLQVNILHPTFLHKLSLHIIQHLLQVMPE